VTMTTSAFRFWALPALMAIGVLPVATVPATAQVGAARLGAQNGALGGASALGAMTHPLGGFSNGFVPGFSNGRFGVGSNRSFNGAANNGLNRNRGRGAVGFPYAYSVWVPDYFDYLNQAAPYGAPYGYAPPPGPEGPNNGGAPQQPVIINQYFSSPAPGTPEPPQQSPAPEANNGKTAAPGAPVGEPQNYYLIAYKDHAIYPALAYWMEDKTLHYVTTENTHNQASLDLIDLALTKRLNQDHNVSFSLPGQ
jgi:hypothetical protein